MLKLLPAIIDALSFINVILFRSLMLAEAQVEKKRKDKVSLRQRIRRKNWRKYWRD